VKTPEEIEDKIAELYEKVNGTTVVDEYKDSPLFLHGAYQALVWASNCELW